MSRIIKADEVELYGEGEFAPDSTPDNPMPARFGWRELWLAFGLAWLIFVVCTPRVTTWLNPVTGDEPFYLMTTQSLLVDGDLDETNNYNLKEYWKFSPSCNEIMTPRWGSSLYEAGIPAPGIRLCSPPFDRLSVDLPPHFSKEIIQSGNYTKHGLGLSFLIAPAFALGDLLGNVRLMVVIFIGMLAAALGVNILLLAQEATGRKAVAWAVWGTLVFSLPLFSYGFLIFPAIPAALCVLYAFRRIRLGIRNNPESANIVQVLLVGGCIGFLPWLHSLYLLLSAALFAYWLFGGHGREIWEVLRGRSKQLRVGQRQDWDKITLFFIPMVIFGAVFVWYFLHFYGKLQPNEQDHAGFAPWDKLGNGVFGLFFDQKWGLLPYAPVYIVALVGLGWLLPSTGDPEKDRLSRSDFIWLMVIMLPYFSFIARYNQWWGEWCPPARYLVPILPLLALPLAVMLNSLKKLYARIFYWVLAGWGFVLAAGFVINPKLFYHWQDDQPAKVLLFLEDKVSWLHGVNLASWLPTYVTNLAPNAGLDNFPIQVLWIGSFILIGLVFYFGVSVRPSRQNKAAHDK